MLKIHFCLSIKAKVSGIKKYKLHMKKILPLIFILGFFTNCSKEEVLPTAKYTHYYPAYEAVIAKENIPDCTVFDPRAIAISNEKLYVTNVNSLEVFDAITLTHIKTIKEYSKGDTKIPFTNLTSVCVNNGRLYVGSTESRLFVFDEITHTAINTVGNGKYTGTFVHVFGVLVKDGLLFVKEKNNIIKVFDASEITDTSDWNLKPIAKLNTLKGYKEVYSLDVFEGNLVVAGRDAKSYLYYNIENIRVNAAKSLITPIEPEKIDFEDTKPISVAFNTNWVVTSENDGRSISYLRLYPKQEFMNKNYKTIVNTSNIMNYIQLGTIVGTSELNDRIFLSDNTNKKIIIIKINTSTIAEQKN